MAVETSEQNASQFLIKILSYIGAHKGAAEPLYDFFSENQAKLDDRLLQTIPLTIPALINQLPETQKQPIASALITFGRLIQNFSAAYQEINIELAIAAYLTALQIYDNAISPNTWALVQSNLGSAYYARIREDPAENLEQAIHCLKQALTVYSREEFPIEWARVQNTLGSAYSDRIQHNRAENLELAIAAYQQALTIRTHQAFPIEWATTQLNIGSLYSERIHGDRTQNLELAINTLQQALQVLGKVATSLQWATAQLNLGNAYSDRIEGDIAENLEQAIAAYQQALQVYTPEDFPFNWAATQMNLGAAYRERIRGTRTDNLQKALIADQRALTIITRENAPIKWATLQNGLGNTYSEQEENRAENIEQAICAYQTALQIFTPTEFSIRWAKIQNNLSTVYAERIRGDRAENLEQALEAAQQALKVFTLEDFSVEWSQAQNNLGNAYSDRLLGDRVENLECAITAYLQTLTVRNRQTFPTQWASTQNNLATAYCDRIKGDKGENLKNAIAACQKALQVYTCEIFPVNWAMVQNNLGNAYSNLAQPDDLPHSKTEQVANLENAINAFHKALQVYTCDTFPVDWAMTQNNLGNVYRLRMESTQPSDPTRAIEAYQQALQIYTPDLLPNDCRRTARSLGDLLSNAHRWPEAVAAYEQSLQATELLYQASLFRSSQEVELSETDNLFRQAAFALAKTSDFQAVAVTLERGRARGLSETLERDRADLTQLAEQSPERYQQYQAAVEALRELEVAERSVRTTSHSDQLPRSPEERRQRATHIRQDFKTAIESIRQLPGYETFLNPPDFSDIKAVLHPAQPLVYLTTTANGSLSLILSADPEGADSESMFIQPIWQEAFTEDDLQSLLFGSSVFGLSTAPDSWFGAYSNRQTEPETWLKTMEQVTEHLWSPLIAPIVTYLSQLKVNQAVLIPTGLLGLLPLHAAWTVDAICPTGRRYAVDTIQFSYIPNAQSLQAARAIANRIPAHSLLAVDEPRPTTASELPNSAHEVQTAIAALPNHTLLRHKQATRSAIQALLPQHTALHFSGHGFAQLDSPLESCKFMANDKILTLLEIHKL
ncbi:MAG: tetratricopeptide repeat protein, partial [Cyanobacteria bacterium J06649_4]